jgi:hypothetical protein
MSVSMPPASHTAMTTFTELWNARHERGDGPDLLTFEAWRRADPYIAVFTDLDDLRRYLVGCAALRTPDPAIGAVARMIVADGTNHLAAQVYLEAFDPALSLLAGALSRHSGRSLATCSRIALEEVLAVACEAAFRGEAHAGATVMSRTWARSVAVALCSGRRSRLKGEIVAAYLRVTTAIESIRQALAGRSVFDRVEGRLAPLDVVEAGRIAKLGAVDINGAFREAAVLRWAARRQVTAYRSRAERWELECDELCAGVELALEDVSWEAFGGDDSYEGDPDDDDPDDGHQGGQS